MSSLRLGLVQPRTYWGADERRNLDEARSYVAQAAALEVSRRRLLQRLVGLRFRELFERVQDGFCGGIDRLQDHGLQRLPQKMGCRLAPAE